MALAIPRAKDKKAVFAEASSHYKGKEKFFESGFDFRPPPDDWLHKINPGTALAISFDDKKDFLLVWLSGTAIAGGTIKTHVGKIAFV